MSLRLLEWPQMRVMHHFSVMLYAQLEHVVCYRQCKVEDVVHNRVLRVENRGHQSIFMFVESTDSPFQTAAQPWSSLSTSFLTLDGTLSTLHGLAAGAVQYMQEDVLHMKV